MKAEDLEVANHEAKEAKENERMSPIDIDKYINRVSLVLSHRLDSGASIEASKWRVLERRWIQDAETCNAMYTATGTQPRKHLKHKNDIKNGQW